MVNKFYLVGDLSNVQAALIHDSKYSLVILFNQVTDDFVVEIIDLSRPGKRVKQMIRIRTMWSILTVRN